MRKVAKVRNKDSGIKKVIVYETENDGVYLFPCNSFEDGSAIGDDWCQSIEEADAICSSKYEISQDDWKIIDDPQEFCQHDWIMPVRIKGRNNGNPEWGKFERLVNRVWEEFIPKLHENQNFG